MLFPAMILVTLTAYMCSQAQNYPASYVIVHYC